MHLSAPAKINLTLNVTGKREDGYHLLHSLAMFSDFGDELSLTPADDFLFTCDGEFSSNINLQDNLVITAAQNLAQQLDQKLNCHIHLEKNIPISAGLGGGSSDAAASVKMLLKFWDMNMPADKLQKFLLSLGADVPACYFARPCIFEGIGEIITPVASIPSLHAVLVYPHQFSSTPEVFKKFISAHSEINEAPHKDNFLEYIASRGNDLTTAAIINTPDIQEVLNAIKVQKHCLLSRMSGSGSCCFGLFNTKDESIKAAQELKKKHPQWWVQSVILKGA